MSAEETVFSIDDLRKHIFSFLRAKPHKSCKKCDCVLEWDKGNKKCASTSKHYQNNVSNAIRTVLYHF